MTAETVIHSDPPALIEEQKQANSGNSGDTKKDAQAINKQIDNALRQDYKTNALLNRIAKKQVLKTMGA